MKVKRHLGARSFITGVVSVHQRISEFITTAFPSVQAAADAMDHMDAGNLRKYLKEGGSEPGWVILNRLWQVGCNPRWLIDGQGSMFADNEAGRTLEGRIVDRSNAWKMPHFVTGQRVPDEYPGHNPMRVTEPEPERHSYGSTSTSVDQVRIKELEREIEFLRGQLEAYKQILSTLAPQSHGTRPPASPGNPD